jgi:hypothetical protein
MKSSAKASAKLLPTDVAALTNVTVTEDEITARLQAHGLGIKRVTKNPAGALVVHWKKPPVESEMAFAQELAGAPVQHA